MPHCDDPTIALSPPVATACSSRGVSRRRGRGGAALGSDSRLVVSGEMRAPIATVLGHRRRLVIAEFRGRCARAWLPGPVRTWQFCGHLAALLRHLGFEATAVRAHSQRGPIARNGVTPPSPQRQVGVKQDRREPSCSTRS